MTELGQYLFSGAVFGALLALVGIGTSTIFRTTRVLNFAQGGVMATAGYAVAHLVSRLGGGTERYWLVVPIAALVGAGLGLVLGLLMLTASRRASDFELSIASLGVSFILTWLDRVRYGADPVTVPPLASGEFTVGGVRLSNEGLVILALTASVAAGFYLLLDHSRIGLAMKAVSEDEGTARSYGVSRRAITLTSWAIGCGIAGAAGVVVGSYLQIDGGTMLNISIMSLAALVVGGLGSSAGALAGGLAVGIVSTLVSGYLTPNYKNSIVFLIVLAVLIVRPQGLFGTRHLQVAESGSATGRKMPSLPAIGTWRGPKRVATTTLGFCLLLALPVLRHPYPLTTYAVLLATAAAILSIGLLQYYVGELSLGHGALVTVGGYTVASLMERYTQVPFFLAALCAVVLTAMIGGVTAVVTLRMSGLYLGIATIVLVYVVTEVANQLVGITGGPNGLSVLTPSLGLTNLDDTTYYLALAVFALVAIAGSLTLRSRLGYRVVALRDAPQAAESYGVATRRVRTTAFALSSGMAGLSGAALAVVVSHIGPADYGLLWSFTLITGAVIGGGRLVIGSLIGGAFVTLTPVAFSGLSGLSDGLFGITLVVFIVLAPGGLPALWGDMISAVTRLRCAWPARRRAPEDTATRAVSITAGDRNA